MKSNKKNIAFGEPCIDKNFYKSIKSNLDSKWIGTGPLSKKFEIDMKV